MFIVYEHVCTDQTGCIEKRTCVRARPIPTVISADVVRQRFTPAEAAWRSQRTQAKDIEKLMRTGRATKPAPPALHLRNDAEIAVYIEGMRADGGARAVPVALPAQPHPVLQAGVAAKATHQSRV
jgi:hypothetical protein